MRKHIFLKVIIGIVVLSLLAGCTPEEESPKGDSSKTDSTGSSWLSDHTLEMPEYELSEASMENVKLAQELYEELLSSPPVDFNYGGKRFSEDTDSWEKIEERTDNGIDVTYTHKDTGLSVLLQFLLYDDASAVEWKTRVLNNGASNSFVIEDFNTFSMQFESKGNTSFLYSKGGNASDTDFEPVTVALKNGDSTKINCNGGRSSSGVMPFFNLYTAKDKGYIGAIGWSGQWKAEVSKENNVVAASAGMTDSCFYLEPGESVMLPSMLLLPWEGEAQDGHNDLRRYILYHHTPVDDEGDLIQSPLSFGIWGSSGTETAIQQANGIINRELDYDVLWIDAGWYGTGEIISENTYDSAWYETAGTWTEITSLYPNGIEEVSAKVNENGMGFLLWFEPERAFAGSELVTKYPEWFLSYSGDSDDFIFNLGDEEAREWLCDYIAGLIKQYGVDIYRQDYNIDPLEYWREADEENRSGITEMKYIEGLYLYWEGLLERCPGLIIDNCASGGRRLDFEALSRATVLSRSDYQCYTDSSTAEGCQMQVYGLNFWLPLTGTITMGRTDSYNWRSNYGFAIQTPNTLSEYKEQVTLNEEFKKIREYFCGDYYPLTECTMGNDGWFVYQMNRSDMDSGFICAFRRLQEEEESITVKPSGLVSDATYKIEVSDTGEIYTETGAKLMEKGFTIAIDRKKDSRMIYYEMVE